MLLAHDIEKGTRTGDVRISQDVTFDSMLLTSNTSKGLKNSGFFRPSPIQLHGIPLGKCGFDLLLEAKSGTGKTAVFTVIALEKLDLGKGLQGVILAPTREIAAQIHDVIKQIGSDYEGLKVEVVMGGLSVQEDISKFKKKNVHIVVGSPGRLRHLIQEKYIDVSAVRLLVLDEADKLMEKSFKTDINYIFTILPKQKQVIMSSATYPEDTRSFIDKYVQNSQHICPESNSILLGVAQKVTTVKYNANVVKQTQHRFVELLKILSQKQFKQCLIFCNYQARVVELHKMLTREKWPAEQLYGQQDQTDRLDALKTLQEYKCRILVSTDLAARGIDASNVDLVINFETPSEWQTYLHRIGRAGRFGSYGIAVTILSEGKEKKKFEDMMESLKVSLTEFWIDDNKFSNEDLNSLSPLLETCLSEPLRAKGQVEEKHQNLMDLLFGSSQENRKEIESFETMCKSFDESIKDTTIEPFSDLVNSFQNHQLQTNTYETNGTYKHLNHQQTSLYETNKIYKHLKMQVMTAKECFSLMRNENNSKIELSAIKNISSINESDKQNFEGNNGNLENHANNGNDIVCSNIQGNDYMEQIMSTMNGYCSNNFKGQSNEIKNEYEFTTPDVTEALRNAGLPTAFGKPKIKYNESKRNLKGRYKNKSKQNVDENNTFLGKPQQKNNLSKDTQKLPVKSTRPTKTTHTDNVNSKHKNPYDQSSIGSSDSDDCISHEHRKSQCNAKFNSHGNDKFRCINEVDNSECTMKREVNNSVDSNHKLSQSYINWYNQLKFKVKQIEYAVYMEEMSKL